MGDDDFDDDGMMGGEEGAPPAHLVPLPESLPAPAFFVARLLQSVAEIADPPLAKRLTDPFLAAVAQHLSVHLEAAAENPPGPVPRIAFGLLDLEGTLAVPPALLPPAGSLDLDAATPLNEDEIMPLLDILVRFVDDVARERKLPAGARAKLAEAVAWAAASLFDHAETEIDGMPGAWRVAPLVETAPGQWLVPGEGLAVHEIAHGMAEATIASRFVEDAETWPPARLFVELASLMASRAPTPTTFYLDDGATTILVADKGHKGKTEATVATWRYALHYGLTEFGIEEDAAEKAASAAVAALAKAWRRPIAGLTPVLALQAKTGAMLVPEKFGTPPRRAPKSLAPAWCAALADVLGQAMMAGCAAAGISRGVAAFAATLALESLLARFDGGHVEIGGATLGHRLAARDAAGGFHFPPARARLAALALPAMKRRYGGARAGAKRRTGARPLPRRRK
jgi:hypothetical protein